MKMFKNIISAILIALCIYSGYLALKYMVAEVTIVFGFILCCTALVLTDGETEKKNATGKK